MKICCFILLGLLFCFAVFSIGFDCKKYSLNDPDAGSSGDDKPKPEAPSNLVATAVSMAQINLTWKDNSKVEDGFKIERSTDGATYAQLTTLNANAVSYSDSGLITDTVYHYRVCAYNKKGDSGYSNAASTVTFSGLSNSGGGSWPYYKAITIANSAGVALTDYSVPITLTSVSLGSPYLNIKSDGADIRFALLGQTTEIPYWIESFSNTSDSIVWVKIPSIPTGDSYIHMYYGNISATSSSNGDNTFEFFDDFNSTFDTAKWDRNRDASGGGCGAFVQSGLLYVYGGDNTAVGWVRSKTSLSNKLSVESRIKVYHANDHASGGFVISDDPNITDMEAGKTGVNYIYWTPYDGLIWAQNHNSFAPRPKIAGLKLAGYWQDIWFRQKLCYDGTITTANFTYVRDMGLGEEIITNTAVTTTPQIKILIQPWAWFGAPNQRFYVDWVFARKYSSIEPAVSFGENMPVAHWKFDETSGITAADSSAFGNDGTVSGATWANGALSFDGVNDYVDAGNSSTLKITGQMTVQAWFKTVITGSYMAIVGSYDCYGPTFPANNKKGYMLYMGDSGKIKFDIYKYQSADAYDAAETNSAFNDGAWHQAVGVFPANGVDRVQIYIDGVLQDVIREGSAKTDCTASTVNLMIGRIGHSNYQLAANYFKGQLDDVKIYNYTRSAGDILSDYNSYKPTMLANTPWPIFMHDNRHSGLSPYTGSMTNTLKWFYTTGGVIEYPAPVIDTDGTIYVGSRDCKLHAVNPNGTIKWSYMTAGWVCGSATISLDGTIYVGSADKKLHAINPNGTVKWTYLTGGSVSSSPAIATDGTIYVGTGSGDNKLYAINPNGSLKWTYPAGYIDTSAAIGADGTIYIGSENSKLYAINPDGSLKWDYTMGNVVKASPSIGADGTIYAGCYDSKLYAINPDGSLKWTYTTGDNMCSAAAIGTDGTIYVGCYDNKLYAIDPDGSFKWSYTTGGDISSSPAIGADGTIYVGSADNKIYAINSNGTLKWSYTTGNFVDSSPSIGADGTIYVGSRDGKLYAIGP